MRVAAATIALVGSGLLAGHALADTVPIPPVPLPVPTVTVPTLPPVLPPPTSPTLPTPAPAAPSAVPTPSAATPAVPTVQSVPAGSGAAPGGSSGGSSSSTASSSSASSAPRSDRPTVERFRFRSSRNWIATSGPKRRRVTTLTFGLPSAARVAFVVEQVSPLCKIADHFAVDGQAGLNRIRFPRAASRLQLEPGTYWITARTRSGRVVRRVTIVVVDAGVPTRDQIAAARASNVCGAAGRLAAAATGSTGASNTSNQVQGSFIPAHPSASGPSAGRNTHSGAVLAASVDQAARAIRPILVALLLVAIVLLGIASLPPVALPDSRANEVLARHRLEIAGLGAAAFVAVVVAFILG